MKSLIVGVASTVAAAAAFAATATRLSAMDQLPEWDASKADDPQFLMNIAKHACVMSVLKASADGTATFETIYQKAEELHCDVVTAALNSMKRKKVISYDK